jgi:cathepsin B
VSCSWNLGCSGGILYTTWVQLEFFGITTDKCYPYTSGEGKVARCSKTCPGTDEKKPRSYVKLMDVHAYDNPDAIKLAIYNDGPISTGFSVYKDFMTYKSGVYKHVSGDFLGGHAVKIVGWGN